MAPRILHLLFFLAFLLLTTEKILAEPAPLTIGFGSCWAEPDDTVWKRLTDKNFEAFILLGDNTYLSEAELPAHREYTKAYDLLFSGPLFQRFQKSTELFPIWDDHDFGPNNSDSTYSERAFAEKIFRHYWKIPPRPTGFSKGIHRSVKLGDITVILTDNRSFRDPRKGVLFGDDQLNWIHAEIKNAPSLVLLASGGQLLTSGPFHEDLEEYPAEHRRLFEILLDAKNPVLIVSGDRHIADLLVRKILDKEIIEITSSPLSGKTRPKRYVSLQKGRVKHYRASPNYGSLTIHQTATTLTVVAQIHLLSGEPVITKRFTFPSNRKIGQDRSALR